MANEFGEKILKQFGWREGEGLGRNKDGISEAIKPKLKFNSEGLGHKQSKEFTNHWWDHKFNEIANNLTVVEMENGDVKLKQKDENKSKEKVVKHESRAYNGFIKGGTYANGSLQEAESASSSESETDERADLISKLTAGDLLGICNGITAHKGARHGIGMSAKLERINRQEQVFKDGKNASPVIENNIDYSGNDRDLTKKKKRHLEDLLEEEVVTKKKSKQQKSQVENPQAEEIITKKKSKKDKSQTEDSLEEEIVSKKKSKQHIIQVEEDPQEEKIISKKKSKRDKIQTKELLEEEIVPKNKSKKHKSQIEDTAEEEIISKKKSKKEKSENKESLEEEIVSKKKSKKRKNHIEDLPEEENITTEKFFLNISNLGEPEYEKVKKKSKKKNK